MRQTRLPIDWIIGAEQSSSDSSSPEEQVVRRGRPEHPLQWTRVQTFETMKSEQIMIHDFKKDLQLDKLQKTQQDELEHGDGCFMFDPFKLNTQSTDFSIAANKLSDDELLKYAKLSTELRQSFSQKADTLASKLNQKESASEEVKDFRMPKLYRGCKRDKRKKCTKT